jgi:autotransporter strand-loop-strand O-heptosyltransferase
MISGFSLPNTEFYTPYRVINYTACVGCWDDTKENFDHNNFLWCPRHSGNEDRMYECTRYITPAQVINTIKTIPTFKPCEKK